MLIHFQVDSAGYSKNKVGMPFNRCTWLCPAFPYNSLHLITNFVSFHNMCFPCTFFISILYSLTYILVQCTIKWKRNSSLLPFQPLSFLSWLRKSVAKRAKEGNVKIHYYINPRSIELALHFNKITVNVEDSWLRVI